MKRTIFTILLLACRLAFAQKLQEVSANGSPVSLSVKHGAIEDCGVSRMGYEVLKEGLSEDTLEGRLARAD